MGDRITLRLTDGEESTPTFYGHWCGLRAIKVMNDVVREHVSYDMYTTFCNFIVEVMERRQQDLSYSVYNLGEGENAADGDNYHWVLNLGLEEPLWRTTHPKLNHRAMTMDEADEYVRSKRPCLYRECPCINYRDERKFCPRRKIENRHGNR